MNFSKSLTQRIKQRRVRNTLIGLYVALILGMSVSARASDMRIFPQPPKATQSAKLQSFVGEMMLSADGQFFLMTEDSAYELRSSRDLSNMNGQMVEVIGFEIKHKVGPVYQLQSVTPPQTDEEQLPAAPVVIVYNVSVLQ